jgi:replicative DNA helicase
MTSDIQNILNGLSPHELTLIAGRAGMGKTTVLNFIGQLLAINKRVLFVSLEYTTTKLTLRFGKTKNIIYTDKLNSIDEIEKIVSTHKIDVVLIDFIQLLNDKMILKRLKMKAAKLNINIIATAQLRRNVDFRPPDERHPIPRDLEFALRSNPYQYANQLIFLYRHDYYDNSNDKTLDLMIYQQKSEKPKIVTVDFEALTLTHLS